MHCKSTRLMPVTNKLFTCSFYGFYTQQLIVLVKFNLIRTLKSSCVKWAVWECFLIFIPCWKCRPRVFNAAPEGLCAQHFYTVLYGVMMFYFFYFAMLLHIWSITVSTGKGCSYNPTDKWNNASLIWVFWFWVKPLMPPPLSVVFFSWWRAECSFWTLLKP